MSQKLIFTMLSDKVVYSDKANPDAISKFGEAVSIPVNIVQDKGHMLGKDYVGQLLDRWLSDA